MPPIPKYVGGLGPSNAKLAIVGQSPGVQEDHHGEPFWPNAPVGSMLMGILNEFGLRRDEVYLTNTYKYFPWGDDVKNYPKMGIDTDKEIYNLHKELTTLKPNVILALGSHALKALTGKSGINKYRGSILTHIEN